MSAEQPKEVKLRAVYLLKRGRKRLPVPGKRVGMMELKKGDVFCVGDYEGTFIADGEPSLTPGGVAAIEATYTPVRR